MRRTEELLWRPPRLAVRALSRLGRGSWLAASLLGCAGGEADSTDPTRARYCGALCTRLAACAPGAQLSSCSPACELDPDFEQVNEQLWNAQAECISRQTCEALATQAAQDGCFEEARAKLVASETCIAFCVADATASFECGAGHSVESCVGGPFCTLRDEVLAAGIGCNQRVDCDERAACLRGVFGP